MNRLKFQDKTCCFTGHREVPDYMVKEIDEWVERTIIDLYCNYGVRFFGSGGASGSLSAGMSMLFKDFINFYIDGRQSIKMVCDFQKVINCLCHQSPSRFLCLEM